MTQSLWMWGSFLAVVFLLLFLDLGIFHRKQREIGTKESLWMSGFYITISILFGFWIWNQLGFRYFAEYITGFLVEKSLSLDNIFVISLIFSSLSIPKKYQHRVLFWGIVGVIILRAIMIASGAQLVHNFSWVLYVFAVFLIATGFKMLFMEEQKTDITNNPILKAMRSYLNITENLQGQRFWIKQEDPTTKKQKYFATPLFLALIFIEISDIIFAVDSIPAIFTITADPYIIYTSNIFAILGLRALYFALDSVIKQFHYLKFSLAAVLIFIGSKVFIAHILDMEKFPPSISLGVTIGLLGFGCLYSMYHSQRYVKKIETDSRIED